MQAREDRLPGFRLRSERREEHVREPPRTVDRRGDLVREEALRKTGRSNRGALLAGRNQGAHDRGEGRVKIRDVVPRPPPHR